MSIPPLIYNQTLASVGQFTHYNFVRRRDVTSISALSLRFPVRAGRSIKHRQAGRPPLLDPLFDEDLQTTIGP